MVNILLSVLVSTIIALLGYVINNQYEEDKRITLIEYKLEQNNYVLQYLSEHKKDID